MKPPYLLPFLAAGAATLPLSNAATVELDLGGVLNIVSPSSFFDESAALGSTYFQSVASFETSSLKLSETRDASEPDQFFKTWNFHGDGMIAVAFGNYMVASPMTSLWVTVGQYAWNPDDHYDITFGLQYFVTPLNPDSPTDYTAQIPFSRDGVAYSDLLSESPYIYFGGGVSVDAVVQLADPAIVTDDWVASTLWSELDGKSFSGMQNFFAGTFAPAEAAFGSAVAMANTGNQGYTLYRYKASEEPSSVPDTGSTLLFSLLGVGCGAAFRHARRCSNSDDSAH